MIRLKERIFNILSNIISSKFKPVLGIDLGKDDRTVEEVKLYKNGICIKKFYNGVEFPIVLTKQDEGELSNCCGATAINGICSDCNEHCDINKFDCELCEDTGEVSIDEMDKEGNWQRGVGVRTCECRFTD